MASLMAVVALAPLAGEETDAAVGDGGTYSYTLTYNSAQMEYTAAQETQLTVEGMTPISHAAGDTTLASLNEGSWSFNTTTGVGPFNSFYGAFDIDDGNKFVARLDPYDLSKTIFGDALPTGNYNIMWILPTVYWVVDQSGNITLTNDSTAGGTAYAHMIDDHVYNYIAIGVYSGSYDSTHQKLTSTSNSTPISNMTRSDARSLAQNYTMDSSLSVNQNDPAYSMLWNFYQWNLCRICSLMVMEGFNSQAIVGNGPNAILPANCLTGQGDSLGPYAGLIGTPASNDQVITYGSDIVKLFIENNWGYYTFVDGVVYYNGSMFIDSSHSPTDAYTTGTNVVSQHYQVYGGGSIDAFGGYILTGLTPVNSQYLWGITSYENINGNVTKGTTDGFNLPAKSDSAYYSMATGGYYPNGANYQTGQANHTGLNSTRYTYALDATSTEVTSRLAFVFDADPPEATSTVSFDIGGVGYGTLSTATDLTVETGSEITISGTTGNILTIGSDSVTATPAAATSDYTYSFDGWFNGSTQLETGDTVDEDMTITAKFSRAAILTVTLDAGKGTVSSSSLTVVEGQPIGDLPTPTPKAGYTFTGWFDSEGNEVTSETIVTETESFTLYAQYELDDSLKPVKAMTDLLPLIFVVGIIILMIGTAFYYYRP